MSLVRRGPAVTSLDEGIAVSTLFRAAKLVGDQIVPTFQSKPARRQFYLAVQHKMF
jgi:hypothetical protein